MSSSKDTLPPGDADREPAAPGDQPHLLTLGETRHLVQAATSARGFGLPALMTPADNLLTLRGSLTLDTDRVLATRDEQVIARRQWELITLMAELYDLDDLLGSAGLPPADDAKGGPGAVEMVAAIIRDLWQKLERALPRTLPVPMRSCEDATQAVPAMRADDPRDL